MIRKCAAIVLIVLMAIVLIRSKNSKPRIEVTERHEAEIIDYNAPEREAIYKAEDKIQAQFDKLLKEKHEDR